MRSIQLTNVAQTGGWLGEGAITLEGPRRSAATGAALGIRGDLDLYSVGRSRSLLAQILAAQIGPFVAEALNDDGLAAHDRDDAELHTILRAEDSIDAVYREVARLVQAPAGSDCGVLGQLVERLADLAPGAFVPPTIAVVAARRC